jgi:hypothetical protein
MIRPPGTTAESATMSSGSEVITNAESQSAHAATT